MSVKHALGESGESGKSDASGESQVNQVYHLRQVNQLHPFHPMLQLNHAKYLNMQTFQKIIILCHSCVISTIPVVVGFSYVMGLTYGRDRGKRN